MTQQIQAMLWAAFILATALVLKEQGVSASASMGVVMGLSGAAMGTITAGKGKKGCC